MDIQKLKEIFEKNKKTVYAVLAAIIAVILIVCIVVSIKKKENGKDNAIVNNTITSLEDDQWVYGEVYEMDHPDETDESDEIDGIQGEDSQSISEEFEDGAQE